MTVPEAVEHQDRELNLLPVLYDRRSTESAGAAIGSLVLHLVFAAVWFSLPPTQPPASEAPLADLRRATPLIAPRPLTQTAPNRNQVSKEFDLEGLLARPSLQSPVTARPSPPPGFRLPPAPKPGVPAPPRIEEAPQIAQQVPQNPASLPGTQLEAPPPQIEAREKAKLAFEPVGTPMTNERASRGLGRVARPRSTVDEAIREVARGGSGGGAVVVGDLGDSSPGSVNEGFILTPSRPKTGSTLELLSDPKGVDFRPYLIRVLAAVRRNWFSVIPESAHLGRRGRVQVQFAISRDGQVPKLVIALPSGAESLDRAAVAGISASNPFPPLPAGFQGDQIRLQLTFTYNLRPE